MKLTAKDVYGIAHKRYGRKFGNSAKFIYPLIIGFVMAIVGCFGVISTENAISPSVYQDSSGNKLVISNVTVDSFSAKAKLNDKELSSIWISPDGKTQITTANGNYMLNGEALYYQENEQSPINPMLPWAVVAILGMVMALSISLKVGNDQNKFADKAVQHWIDTGDILDI